jgi:ABC-2 type transport system permease protein
LVRGDLPNALYHLTLLWSNGLFIYLLAAVASSWLYRRGYNRLTTGGDLQRRRAEAAQRKAENDIVAVDPTANGWRLLWSVGWVDHVLYATLPFLQRSTRLLIVKDFRTFRRDPQQWGQILAFSGLLLLYFLNMRRFIDNLAGRYQNSISFLNLCAVALLLCTYTGRFVYPMLSLEGRKFWILGLLPLKREQLLWGKFAFAMTGGLLISAGLVLLSDLMLLMPLTAILLHLLTVTVLAAGLSGLSVGLGACMPNFRETDPSKIAAGFGGTLNLVAGLLYLLLILGFMTVPWHVQTMLTLAEIDGPHNQLMGGIISAGMVLGLAIGVAGVLLPLRAGIRALRSMEF